MDEQQGEKQLQQTEQQQELAGAAAAAVRDAAAAADAGQVTSASDAKSDNAAASGLGGLLDQLPKLPQTLSEQAVREAQQGAMLQLTMQPDEDDFMMQVGALSSVCPGLAGAELAVSPRVSSHAAAESVKMLFMFQNLRRLQLRLDFDSIQISQGLVCAIAELMQLTSLQLLHGSIAPGLVLAHWSSLKQLAELTLLPAEQAGLGDAQLEQLPLLSPTLTSLAIRPHPSRASQAGRRHLTALAGLRQLSVCPVGCGLSRGELQALLGMPALTQLTLGLKDASEVLLFGQMQLSQASPRLCLAVLDGQPRLPPSELLSVLSWSLAAHLVKLAIGPLAAACPGDVLLMLATLKQLQELKLQLVAPLDTHSSGTLDLLALTPLRRLTCLELLASSRLYVPLNVKVISLASLAWPQLAALRLSLAGKPELMAESLALCDNFACLTELQLFSPVDDLAAAAAAAAAANSAAAAAIAPLAGSSSSSGGVQSLHAEQQVVNVERHGSGSWVDWAVAGLSSLHISSSSSTGPVRARSSSSSMDGSGIAFAAGRSRSGPVRSSIGSPLARDVMQQQLVRQRQAEAQQRLLQVPPRASFEEEQLPAAVGAFQHYKVLSSPPRMNQQYSGSTSNTVPARRGSTGVAGLCGHHPQQQQQQQQHHLEGQGSGAWSPRWLLQSFASLGSPAASRQGSSIGTAAAADAFSAAADAAAAADGSGAESSRLLDHGAAAAAAGHGSPRGAWSSRIMAACSGVTAGTARYSLDAALVHNPRSAAAAARSAAAAAAAAAGQLQPGNSTAAGAAPGCDMAMYRASSRMLPIVLNYLPHTLSKLCLECFHLVAIGLPAAADLVPRLPRHSTASYMRQPPRQQQQQQEELAAAANGSSRLGQQQAAGPQQHPAEEQQQITHSNHKQAAAAAAAAAATGSSTSSSSLQANHCDESSSSTGGISSRLTTLPLQQLLHLELEECCVDDTAMAAVLAAATGLRTLELAACEGLSNTGLAGLTSLTCLTRLVIEAEATPGITLRAFDVISCLTSLASLTWCSRDSLQGPLDCDALTGQLAALTRLRQLVLITGQQELLSSMCGWKVVLARALPLCRLVLWRELVQEAPWGDEPQEGSRLSS